MAGNNSGILRDAYPLSETQVKEVEKDVILNKKCIAYLDENNKVCFANPNDPEGIKRFAWHTAHELFEDNGLFFKKVYTRNGLTTFILSDTLHKNDIDGPWIGNVPDPIDPDSVHDEIAEGAYCGNFSTMTFYSEMPDTMSEGDAYLYGDYMYVYNTDLNGWMVNLITEDLGVTSLIPTYPVTDLLQRSYGKILTRINGIPVVELNTTFWGCKNIDSVGGVGSGASVEIPNSITSIYHAFGDCTSLTRVIIGNNVTSIGNYAFSDCIILESIEIPDSVESIGDYAFTRCSSLERVIIGNGVTSIGEGAFWSCTSLESIIFNGTTAEWNGIEKGNNWCERVPATYVQCSDGQVPLSGNSGGGGEVDAETGEILDSWEVLLNNVNNGTYAAKYAVGNYKPLDMGEQGVVNMQIVAFDTDVLSDDTGNARITWIAKELLPTKHKMNKSFTNAGGWAESAMRDYLQTDVWALIPTDIQNAIVTVDKTYYDKTTNSTLSCEDKVWIPSCREIFGNTDASGVKYTQFFANRPPRRKTINGIIQDWWLRSADVEYGTGFYRVNSNGDRDFDYASSENGIAMSFCF